jgi:hypothetical protein
MSPFTQVSILCVINFCYGGFFADTQNDVSLELV